MRVLIRERQESQRERREWDKGGGGRKADVRPRAKDNRWPLEAGKGKETASAPETPEGTSRHLNPFQASDLQNRKRRNWCCVKLLSLWPFGIPAIEKLIHHPFSKYLQRLSFEDTTLASEKAWV